MFNFILGIIVGGVGVYFLFKKNGEKNEKQENKESLIDIQAREKEENKKKILKLLETQDRIVNNEVESVLGISNATAERYLNELEKEGYLQQIGTDGPKVFYQKESPQR